MIWIAAVTALAVLGVWAARRLRTHGWSFDERVARNGLTAFNARHAAEIVDKKLD